MSDLNIKDLIVERCYCILVNASEITPYHPRKTAGLYRASKRSKSLIKINNTIKLSGEVMLTQLKLVRAKETLEEFSTLKKKFPEIFTILISCTKDWMLMNCSCIMEWYETLTALESM